MEKDIKLSNEMRKHEAEVRESRLFSAFVFFLSDLYCQSFTFSKLSLGVFPLVGFRPADKTVLSRHCLFLLPSTRTKPPQNKANILLNTMISFLSLDTGQEYTLILSHNDT